MSFAPTAALAAAGTDSFSALLPVLAATLLLTKLLGAFAQRVGQPSVLGELIAGVLLGGSVFALFDPANPVLHAIAELGVLILLFQIGLHTDLRSLARVGPTALMTGAVGVLLPFVGGIVVARQMGIELLPSVVIGAALTATSIGISARVLSDLGVLSSPEGQVVIGAAVLDDVIGLIILSVVAGMVAGVEVSVGGIGRTAGIAIGFVVLAIALGSVAIPPLFRVVERIRLSGTLGGVALAFALLLAWAASEGGSAMIIGAFAAGLILHPTPQRKEIERATTQLGYFFVPIFFASVGAAVDLRAMVSPSALAVGGVLIIIGVLGKLLAGFAPWWFKGNRLLVGVAMIPRGEVGLIFAQMGLAAGVLTNERFGALMLMVVVTTFITPPLLGLIAKRTEGPSVGSDNSGIDDLVAGHHTH